MKVDALSQLLDVILDDLSARFIINLPEEELSSVTRICFGLEQAHWFYEDFFRPQYPALPSVNLRAFTAALFSHCPLLWKFSGQHEAAFDDFLKYKIRVPVRGAILLNSDMDQCVLVKGWKASASWGFPKGKIDQEEDDADCAVREVREECGFDVTPYLKPGDYVDVVMKEQSVRLYICHGVPQDTVFETQTRKEISKIAWFPLKELPTYSRDSSRPQSNGPKHLKYYMVAPFLGPLRKWIKKNRPKPKIQQQQQQPRVNVQSTDVVAQQRRTLETPQSSGISDNKTERRDSVDASSRALKLLLGIVDIPQAQEPPRSEHLETMKRDEGSIDLASLFQRPSSHHERPIPTYRAGSEATGQPGSPISMIDTSIDTSIMDQLRPQDGGPAWFGQPRAPLELQSNRLGNQNHSSSSQSYRTSSGMEQGFANPQHTPIRYIDDMQMRHTIEHVVPRSFVSSEMPSYQEFSRPARLNAGPPGLNNEQVLQARPSNDKPTNSNAQSLLAILKPKSQFIREDVPRSTFINSPPAHPQQSRAQDMAAFSHGPYGYSVAAPMQHKQSLLALLKPAEAGRRDDTAQQNPSIPHVAANRPHPSQSLIPTTASHDKDAFFLDYLTKASGG